MHATAILATGETHYRRPVYGRFAEPDLASIIAHRAAATDGTRRASEDHSLQAGTDAWKEFGR
jgi:hypothetical protein